MIGYAVQKMRVPVPLPEAPAKPRKLEILVLPVAILP